MIAVPIVTVWCRGRLHRRTGRVRYVVPAVVRPSLRKLQTGLIARSPARHRRWKSGDPAAIRPATPRPDPPVEARRPPTAAACPNPRAAEIYPAWAAIVLRDPCLIAGVLCCSQAAPTPTRVCSETTPSSREAFELPFLRIRRCAHWHRCSLTCPAHHRSGVVIGHARLKFIRSGSSPLFSTHSASTNSHSRLASRRAASPAAPIASTRARRMHDFAPVARTA